MGPKVGFSLWQQNADPFHYEKPLQERIEVAIALANQPANGPETFTRSLALGPLPSLAPCMTNSKILTPLYAEARKLGMVNSHYLLELALEQREVDQIGEKASDCKST